MSDALQVLPFAADHFFNALAHEYRPVSDVSSSDVAVYLRHYLEDVGAKTMVVEPDYVDRDYLDDFATYYAKCFKPYERRCRRLHFFAGTVHGERIAQILHAGSDEDCKTLQSAYVGFVVARPLPSAVIGRTALRTYPSDNGRRHYPCVRDYDANLYGVMLNVQSLAFQEQDSVLAACATVALWCCLHKTAKLFGTATPSPAEITRVANEISNASRPIPSHGLNVHQICTAIRNVGLEPEVVEVRENVPLVSLIYAHVAFGLPVILGVEVEGVGLHAVTVAGYSLHKQRIREREVSVDGEPAVPMTGLRIDEFYAHDDQFGPFSRLVVRPSATYGDRVYPVTFEGQWKDSTHTLALLPRVAVIPVYHKIRVAFLDIQTWLLRLTVLLRSVFEKQAQLEWDVRLITTNDYKAEVKRGLKEPLRGMLLFKTHPRFIWQTALTVGGVAALDMLADATDMARSFPIYELVWHDDSLRAALAQLFADSPPLTELAVEVLGERYWMFFSQRLGSSAAATPAEG